VLSLLSPLPAPRLRLGVPPRRPACSPRVQFRDLLFLRPHSNTTLQYTFKMVQTLRSPGLTPVAALSGAPPSSSRGRGRGRSAANRFALPAVASWQSVTSSYTWQGGAPFVPTGAVVPHRELPRDCFSDAPFAAPAWSCLLIRVSTAAVTPRQPRPRRFHSCARVATVFRAPCFSVNYIRWAAVRSVADRQGPHGSHTPVHEGWRARVGTRETPQRRSVKGSLPPSVTPGPYPPAACRTVAVPSRCSAAALQVAGRQSSQPPPVGPAPSTGGRGRRVAAVNTP
jgi:hypothetical protein